MLKIAVSASKAAALIENSDGMKLSPVTEAEAPVGVSELLMKFFPLFLVSLFFFSSSERAKKLLLFSFSALSFSLSLSLSSVVQKGRRRSERRRGGRRERRRRRVPLAAEKGQRRERRRGRRGGGAQHRILQVESRDQLLARRDLREVPVRRQHQPPERVLGAVRGIPFFGQEDLREDSCPVAVVVREVLGKVERVVGHEELLDLFAFLAFPSSSSSSGVGGRGFLLGRGQKLLPLPPRRLRRRQVGDCPAEALFRRRMHAAAGAVEVSHGAHVDVCSKYFFKAGFGGRFFIGFLSFFLFPVSFSFPPPRLFLLSLIALERERERTARAPAGAWTNPWGWTEAPTGETAMRNGETCAAWGCTFVACGAMRIRTGWMLRPAAIHMQ